MKLLGVILILVFSSSLSYLQFISIEKPPEYERRDYFLALSNNVGILKVNCFAFPAFPSAFFLNRIKETQGKILLKKDLLVCDFNYSQLNRTTAVTNASIWFVNENSNDLTERELHFNLTGEQLVFPMTQPGHYIFDIWILQSPYTGWEEHLFSNIRFYVYESTDAYLSAVKAYNVSLMTSVLSLFGIVAGLALFALGNLQNDEQREQHSRGTRTRMHQNTEADSKVNTLEQLMKEQNALSSIDLVYFLLVPASLFVLNELPRQNDMFPILISFLFFPGGLLSLPFAIHAKMTDSIAGRVRAWAIYIYISSLTFGLFSLTYVKQEIFPSVGFWTISNLVYFLGVSMFWLGIARAWMKWVWGVFLARLPSKRREVNRARSLFLVKALLIKPAENFKLEIVSALIGLAFCGLGVLVALLVGA